MPVTSVATSASTPLPWQRLLETSREEEHDILEDDVYRDIKNVISTSNLISGNIGVDQTHPNTIQRDFGSRGIGSTWFNPCFCSQLLLTSPSNPILAGQISSFFPRSKQNPCSHCGVFSHCDGTSARNPPDF